MDTFVRVVGYITMAGIAVAVAGVVVSIAASLISLLFDKLKERGANEARAEIYGRLISGSHWFSEHPPTSELMKIYANRLVNHCEGHIDGIRDEWRTSLKKYEGEKSSNS